MSPKIAIAALSAIGITGTGGTLIYKNLPRATVMQKLQEDKTREILNSSSLTTDWEKITSGNTEELMAFIKEHDPNKGEEVSVEKLKAACKSALQKKVYGDNVDKARSYCTKEKAR